MAWRAAVAAFRRLPSVPSGPSQGFRAGLPHRQRADRKPDKRLAAPDYGGLFQALDRRLGIHYNLRDGWVWNLWGRDGVVVHWQQGGVLRIGTDDAVNLARFLNEKITEAR
jgi:hypothetical protein